MSQRKLSAASKGRTGSIFLLSMLVLAALGIAFSFVPNAHAVSPSFDKSVSAACSNGVNTCAVSITPSYTGELIVIGIGMGYNTATFSVTSVCTSGAVCLTEASAAPAILTTTGTYPRTSADDIW